MRSEMTGLAFKKSKKQDNNTQQSGVSNLGQIGS